jgi:hypothetical protein
MAWSDQEQRDNSTPFSPRDVAEADPADVLEQQAPVGPVPPPPSPRRAYDVPEADALEQSMEVPLDDDDDRP